MTLNDYDDLAVAYNKIGEKEKAIELLIPLVKDNPQRFSSISNLGSIYLNIGDYENGLKYLRIANTLKAVDSYNREYAQEKVYSYLKSLNKTLPYSFPIQNINENKNFADFALTNIPLEKQNDEIIRLIFGVENMVRFGNHDSPVSMEVLGDLYLKFKKLNDLNYQLNENILDFYSAALVKSEVKNEESLKKLNNKNNLGYYGNQIEYIEKNFKEVKLKRSELEIKEKEIINNNQDIEKTLNENLISKDSNNLKSSIMNEKDRLYKILKTKDNEEKANYYLDYTKNIDLIAWLLLTIAGVGAYILILSRNNKLIKHLDLQDDEFDNLNSFTKYMNIILFSAIGVSLIFLTSNFLFPRILELFSMTLILAIVSLIFISLILAILNIYLIAFGRYKSNNSYHLSSKRNMKRVLSIGLLAIGLFISTSIAENMIYDKYEYQRGSIFSIFGSSSALRSVN